MNAYEKEHLLSLHSHLAECTVLLRSNGDFPLEVPCKIAAYGSGVRNTVKGGTGSGEVNSRYCINVEQGLENAGFTVTTGNWLNQYEKERFEAKKRFVKEIKSRARAKHTMALMEGLGAVMPEPEYHLPLDAEGDTAIYVLARISGEGHDRDAVRGDIRLTHTEKRDILALAKKYQKFMLVLNVGGVVDLSGLDSIDNILILSQLGVETGAILADILLGKENPSGKLTTTWAAWGEYPSFLDFGDHNDTRYREGIYVGYRYFDTVGKKPMFSFGYGLSFTKFMTDIADVSVNGSKITVKMSIMNVGNFSGKETVQIYLSSPKGILDKPYQELQAFAKTTLLAPGETESVTPHFDLRDAASYDCGRAAYVLEAGDYIVRAGVSSKETSVAAVIRLEEACVVCKVRSMSDSPDFKDWQPGVQLIEEVPPDVPVFTINRSDINQLSVQYDRQEKIEDAVKGLTDEQLIYANIGAFNPGGGIQSVIGASSTTVAGAAGETTSLLKEHGFKSLIMADGPAGLRLSEEYYRDDKGVHSLGKSAIPESVREFLPKVLLAINDISTKLKTKKKGIKIKEQYCTAIPIGTAIAQSFNPDFAKMCGDIVGDEMARFGINLWLAPALNIHRSIRCGRNFEYYSEDPVISGKIAAAVTQGVQAHPGRGVTIKHYAANNQENNRYGNNSIVSERAMREIYLKGFGICIRESHPAAIMTSYNLLNGVHTAERRDLNEDILRSEFGFDGIVMTDWVVGGGLTSSREDTHPAEKPHLVAAAGGTLFMPGSKKDYEDMRNGLKAGKLSRRQLMINAGRLYRLIQAMSCD